jgi:endonuclease/exonuclease/phosphatase family metal-dependent hydrolase
MKGMNLLHRIVFIINSVFALLLFTSYALPYVPPRSFPLLSVLSLSVPVLLIINVILLFYWIFFMKRAFLLSALVLLLGIQKLTSLYKFSGQKVENTEVEFSLMSYNVRSFNFFKWVPDDFIADKIGAFVKTANPDVLCFQDFHTSGSPLFVNYPYKLEKIRGLKSKSGLAVYSKFPILDSGSLEFPDTSNNAIFVDLLIDKDTVRIYNAHFQSLKISNEVNDINDKNYELMTNRIGMAFVKQQKQLEILLAHKKNSPYRSLIAGDFNNTAFSYLYKSLKDEGLKDAFLEAGTGFGQTYNLKFFPLRIDFVMADGSFDINNFKCFSQKYSDHFPIMTRIGL